MEEFLERHGVPLDIVDRFISNGVTLDLFPSLNEEHLKELCPHLGTRIKIGQLITACAQSETNSLDDSIDPSLDHSLDKNLDQSLEKSLAHSLDYSLQGSGASLQNVDILISRAFPDFDLRTLLQRTAGGNVILNYYNTFSSLDSSKRNQLTDIIIKHLYSYIVQSRISHDEYNIIAAKIITLFPKECAGTYFINPIRKGLSPTGKPVVARGKLVDKVRNLLFKFGDRKRTSTTETNKDLSNKRARTEKAGTSNEAKQWLQNHSEPWDEVLQAWKKTFYLRDEGTTYNNIHDIFLEWPILNDLRSEQLINSDFDSLYPDKGLKFFMNWSDFVAKLVVLKNTKDENILSLLNTLEGLDDDLKIPGQVMAIVNLLPPKGRLTKKVKFTTQEAVDSIFMICQNPGDIEDTIEEQKKKAKTRKLNLQPFIILQGSITEPSAPLLVIDNIKYQFNNIAKAFDTLFKAFHAFHAEYPRASSHIHLVIQRCVYKIKTKYDNVIPSIVDVLNL